MAYDASGLVKFGGGGTISTGDGSQKSVLAYATNDTSGTVEGANYFDGAADLLVAGDLILASMDIDGTAATKQYVVKSVSAADVVVVTPAANITYTQVYALTTTITLTDGISGHVVVPIAGTIDDIQTVLKGGAVATNDATCTFKIGTVAITNGVVTITASGSAIADVDSASPSGANTVAVDNYIACTVSNTPGGSRTAEVTLKISPT